MNGTRLLSHDQAARFYDTLGAGLDTQAFYEEVALRELVAHLNMKDCRVILEFGCGTGRLASKLFETVLSRQTRYVGLDISHTMVTLAKARLERWRGSAVVRQSDGDPRIEAADGSLDRFICTYVLDLLADDDIRAVLGEAHRVLTPDGLLGIAGLTNGYTPWSRLVSATWRGLHTISPWLVGGCRPIVIERYLTEPAWVIEYVSVISRFGVPSEIVVAKPLGRN